ncbi:UNVERIFIED_ORG: DNA-binding CsgD family transcriptional regulator [Methylobacterium sp. SuP10 SLI 274]|uniref:helix-turn-helix transcriptional regulator n=1 Tax=Methylorubrum extorquens TaxID=408 RepID=UPI0006F90B17|nr:MULTISPECIES: helix-turn-helix transcriptional regulator [Methylobacteriaceae]MDF9863235.1 DNA-binding CsgD family transcriptional regulator [Methylorubrum pseudosasae]MDH6636846.1 DNA-binding CsgD family transcriptional regulator [Methylobacterium sp. SuP10 SLI 274]MDH6666023.1 DNA-binding CsgD family transcriptional regulator [Methylorubrum zatmanii]KQQ19557.1 hypothetical protein ASF56_21725 [Methylobacterium sp. Leaf122]MCP1557938.1 DNA-binding CsgD family transcriptional regulator [Met
MPLGKPLLDALDGMGYGGLLLDAAGCVIRINTTASRLLADTTSSSLHGDDRAWSSEAADALLRSGAAAGLKGDQDGWVAIQWNGTGPGRPLILRTMQIGKGGTAGVDKAVILIDLGVMPRPSADVLRKLFSLTPSEARLAIEMACGKSAEEIAAAAQVTVSTVRKQLATVFSKTNTHRQAELVALLTRLAILP